jgi:spore germination cell wall hydrolase CwlJ-like protein
MKLFRWSALLLVVLFWPAPPAAAATTEPRHEAVQCLALAMYWEAKAEGREGMLAVASVVLNRVAHPQFPNTVCGVVEQGGETPPCQFSWWCDGASDRPTEARAWQLAQTLARDSLSRAPRDVTKGALFFHNTSIASPWVRPRVRTVQIGRHIFYR